MTLGKAVILEKPAEGVALIRINRPETRNALSIEVRTIIADLLTNFSRQADIRAVVLAGNEKVFAAGADIREMVNIGAIEHLQAGTFRLWSEIAACTKPVVAAVRGFALGGGCELALTCDIIIAGESARFGQPEVRIGVMPGGGATQRLIRTVGKYRAMKYCLTGETFTGSEAVAMGLASEVVPDGRVEERAIELASLVAEMPPLAVQHIKDVILAGQNASLETALRLEAKANQVLFASEDKREGMTAFLEKRKPKWKGR